MWIDITNSENHTVPVYLHGEIKRNGKLIARANSNRINIPQGGKRIIRNDIRKLTDEWWDPEIKKILTRSPVLPEGQYVACVYVYRWGTRQLLTKCCISFQSMPMSPPRLISPKDGAKVSTKYPLFQWTPPQPALRGITYELKIVEVYKGQTKEEAIESNPAWLVKKGIRTTSFRYPSSERPFKQGSQYAWQIRADPGWLDPNLRPGLKSEVGSFIYSVGLKRPIERLTSVCNDWNKMIINSIADVAAKHGIVIDKAGFVALTRKDICIINCAVDGLEKIPLSAIYSPKGAIIGVIYANIPMVNKKLRSGIYAVKVFKDEFGRLTASFTNLNTGKVVFETHNVHMKRTKEEAKGHWSIGFFYIDYHWDKKRIKIALEFEDEEE